MKPGWKTSEFWVTAFVIVGLAVSSVGATLSPRYAAISVTITAASYAFSRGLAKLFPPKTVEVQITPTGTVTTTSNTPAA